MGCAFHLFGNSVKFCQLLVIGVRVVLDVRVGVHAVGGGVDFGGAVFDGGDVPVLAIEDGEAGAEEDRGGRFGVIEDGFEFVEGFFGHGLEAVTEGDGMLLFGEGESLGEGGVFEPVVDGGTGDRGKLSGCRNGCARGEGFDDRDLGGGKGFHGWLQDNACDFSCGFCFS